MEINDTSGNNMEIYHMYHNSWWLTPQNVPMKAPVKAPIPIEDISPKETDHQTVQRNLRCSKSLHHQNCVQKIAWGQQKSNNKKGTHETRRERFSHLLSVWICLCMCIYIHIYIYIIININKLFNTISYIYIYTYILELLDNTPHILSRGITFPWRMYIYI